MLAFADQIALCTGARKPYPLPPPSAVAPKPTPPKPPRPLLWSRADTLRQMRDAFGDDVFTLQDFIDLMDLPYVRQTFEHRLRALVKAGHVRQVKQRQRYYKNYVLADSPLPTDPKPLIETLKERAGPHPFTIHDVIGTDESYSSVTLALRTAIKKGQVEQIGQAPNGKHGGLQLSVYQFKGAK
jgi:hypothetical protein